ncbi:hypothetical protein [Thermogymnomonas acidicola]|uniref:hypothetical protein n=1 Tax=Thermogymnomonas acidicola TaxID=399579 RepID=UPI0009463ED3|nr:hypothetical protein [Thermogymnomonas acidicola]
MSLSALVQAISSALLSLDYLLWHFAVMHALTPNYEFGIESRVVAEVPPLPPAPKVRAPLT